MIEIKNLINFNSVFLRYSNNPEILKDINFQFYKGDFVFLIGESGSGKSSLLNMINLSLKPTRGSLEVLTYNASKISDYNKALVRRRIGIIFQDFKLLPNLNIFDNIALPLKINGTPYKEVSNKVNEMLKWTNLAKVSHYYPPQLSGGQQQCVAIARAVINNPDIILADEPTGNLDYKMESKILSMLNDLNKQGVGIIFATHNMSLIKQYKYAIAMLENNKLTIHNQ